PQTRPDPGGWLPHCWCRREASMAQAAKEQNGESPDGLHCQIGAHDRITLPCVPAEKHEGEKTLKHRDGDKHDARIERNQMKKHTADLPSGKLVQASPYCILAGF